MAKGVDPEAVEHLMSAIDGQLGDLMKTARRAARDAFRRSPRKFGRRLTKSVERDHAPAEKDTQGD